jgi:hypothetical protein
MNLRDYLRALEPEEKLDFASKSETELIYLYHVAAGRKTPSAKLSVRIEAASSGVVSRFELRSDADEIWPKEAA